MEPRNTTNPTPQRGDGGGDEQLQRITQAGKDAASDARRQVRSRLDEGRRSAASAATDAQHVVDDAGARLAEEGHETLAQAAYAASERISSLAHYVETHSLDELTQQARRMARRNPALMIAGGVALGFALSRFFKASSADAAYQAYDDYVDYEPETEPEEWAGPADYPTGEGDGLGGDSRPVQSWPEGRYESGDGPAERETGPSA